MVVSDLYLEKYSHNPIQTLCVHLLGKCSEMICFWPSSGHKITENGGFHHYLKSIHATQFKLGVYIYWVSVQNWFAFCLRWPNFGPLVATKYWKWLFPTIIWKSILAIQFKLGVYTYWVNVQNTYALGPRWPNFGLLVATKWLKMVVSKHYLERYPCNSIQTWCVHFLGECLE